MTQIDLNWKEFNVNLEKVRAFFKSHLSPNYDGMVCDTEILSVKFFAEVSESDALIVSDYWNNINASSFNPTIQEILDQKLAAATQFGLGIIKQAAKENMMMGITQAGKTRAVSNYLNKMQEYLQTGSLYAAIEEIDELIADGLPVELSPFVTQERMLSYKAQLLTFLGG